jgi:uncharacterized membrane protein YeaQ/YmgE (transglycosylase-associated protein family)
VSDSISKKKKGFAALRPVDADPTLYRPARDINRVLLTVAHNDHVRYFATFLIVSGTYTTIGLVIAWYAHNLGSETKRATGTPLYMAIGQCGSVLGTHLFPTTEGPRYIKGFSVLAALLFLGSVCASALTSHYRYENARRNRVYGKRLPNTRVDTSELADRVSTITFLEIIQLQGSTKH